MQTRGRPFLSSYPSFSPYKVLNEKMVNWNAVNNSLSERLLQSGRVEEYLLHLGVVVKSFPGGISFRGPCPVHDGDGNNFEVRTDGDTVPIHWRCHSHGCHKNPKLKPNLVGLVRGALTGDPDRPASLWDAVKHVGTFLAMGGSHPPARPRSKTQRPNFAFALTREQVRNRLLIPSPYFVDRGFDAAIVDRLDIGHSHKQGRAIVPIYDEGDSTCVGFIARTIRPDDTRPRWQFPTNFRSGEWLYNHAAVRNSPTPFVLVVEGVPDVLRATEAGVPAVAAFGVEVSVAQVRKLASLNKEVVVAFDNDEAGRSAAVSAVTLLRREGVQAVIRHPPSGVKDVGEMAAGDVAGWFTSA